MGAAVNGPVVVVNVSRWRCDALVVTTAGVEVVELPRLTAAEVAERTAAFLTVLGDHAVADLSFAAALRARADWLAERERILRATVEWLWDTVAEPVLGALPRDHARVWWCPTGLLTLLPLHGAGYHFDGSGRTVLDRVVSSYTPTLRALAGLTEPSEKDDSPLLFVSVPDVLDQVDLASDVAREYDFLRETFPHGLTSIGGSAATVAAVRAAMADHRRVHLSCHGHQDLNDPSAAGFLLSDGTLTIALLSAARHGGDFAFLSACRTATGGVDLPDEVITLAAALSYTGYRHVVGTLWSVDPAIAAEVTTAVYPELVVDGEFTPDRSATALHSAVRALRDSGRSMDDWLPFTHTGP
ncbi:CHAT domain-containing protein [Actinokineospora sp. NBRC 105648]|uniref:CHAT domain-containing protein n=1 Tax=Actinokineospora sp. NBRC 105648 TaxID=3032206 RepID=UPI002552DCAD|nr:CHAT domain-containing protein [Actinokineospora sp. NBRC 105648]